MDFSLSSSDHLCRAVKSSEEEHVLPSHYPGVARVVWHPSIKRKVVEYLAMGKVACT